MEYLTSEMAAISIIMVFLIKEVFAFLKEKKRNGCPETTIDTKQEIRLAKIEEKLISMEKLTSNHISHIQGDIETIRGDITKICERLYK